MKELIYLAHPYTHSIPGIMSERAASASRISGKIIDMGYFVFSPISMGHHMSEHSKLPTDWRFWEEFDTVMIKLCHRLFVCCVEGWLESVGVQAEIKIAKNANIPISYVMVYGDRLVLHHLPFNA